MSETLNALIGLAVVMLLLSFAVTLLTQFVVGLLNLRGWALRIKVQNLLVLIDNSIRPRDAGQIAGLVLRNAVIGKYGLPWRRQDLANEAGESARATRTKSRVATKAESAGGAKTEIAATAGAVSEGAAKGRTAEATKGPRKAIVWPWPVGFGFRTAEVVQREELVRLLLAFGKEPSEYPPEWHWFGFHTLDTQCLQGRMRTSLACNGIKKPEDVLDALRLRTLELERSQPELSNSERQTKAMLEVADSRFLGKLNGWFDQTVDRAGDLFTGWAHLTAFLMAALIAVVLQLDSIRLIDDLSHRRGARLITPPTSLGDWWTHWCLQSQQQCDSSQASVLGVVLSIFLLSLGGPFWYATVSGLIKLRSTLADKEDGQRKERQTNTAAKPAKG